MRIRGELAQAFMNGVESYLLSSVFRKAASLKKSFEAATLQLLEGSRFLCDPVGMLG